MIFSFQCFFKKKYLKMSEFKLILKSIYPKGYFKALIKMKILKAKSKILLLANVKKNMHHKINRS